jgi:hypothetical protein
MNKITVEIYYEGDELLLDELAKVRNGAVSSLMENFYPHRVHRATVPYSFVSSQFGSAEVDE